MKTNIVKVNGIEIAHVESEKVIITDVQSAVDFIATVGYETGCDRVILNKDAITEDFFELSTRIAGEVLQKFINYHMKIAILGDFSIYKSKSLKDFIYESNKGKNIFFLSTMEQAIEKLSID
jgi:hypothetical protein